MKTQREEGPRALDLVEESLHLLRAAPLSTFAAYYIGALPFMLAALFFWSEMSSGVFAEQRLFAGAVGLALLFVWMKCWQTIFARKLFAQLMGEPEPRWDRPRIVRMVCAQVVLQPSGLFLLPASAIVLMPFAWVLAFYQNATLFGAGDHPGLLPVVKRSWRQAALWSAQNHCILMALKLFSLFVLINVALGALGVPFFLKALLGIETAFSQSWGAALNTTFFACVLALSYLCIDPIIKATYVTRCFHGVSLESADDLRAEFRATASTRQLAGLAACIFLFASPAALSADSTDTSGSAAVLERSISEVIQQPEYSWRMPRGKAATPKTDLTWLERQLERIGKGLKSIMQKVYDWVRKIVQWLTKGRAQNPGAKVQLDWSGAVRGMALLLCAALLVLIGFLLWRMWRQRTPDAAIIATQPLPSPPDLASEHTAANQLPEDGWLALARDLLLKGDLRLALRAYYLASLAHLADKNLITIAPHKSNRDYERELSRRGHALPGILPVFSENVSTFDRVWYGLHQVTRELLDGFAANVNRIRAPEAQ